MWLTADAVAISGGTMLQADAIITLDADRYRLRAPLASSAYGVVWRAECESGAQDVALKLINREQMARAAAPQRERWITSFDNEVGFLRSLEPWDERHIVRLLDSGRHDGLPVLALELLAGDLGKHVAGERNAGRPLPFAQVLDWLGQVNQALAKVHQYGWRYLDLKPANLLINPVDGSVKLADFGTNQLHGQQHPYSGTANWQAPEQFFPNLDQRYDTDTRTDYFALGAMFYYLVTGGLPLRFCSDCGNAYREHPGAAAAVVRARHGGAIPPTLRDDEAALFKHRIERQAQESSELTWFPSGDGDGAAEALALLRTLLASAREGRPRHAMEVSRMIAAVRAALPPASPRPRERGLRLPAHLGARTHAPTRARALSMLAAQTHAGTHTNVGAQRSAL